MATYLKRTSKLYDLSLIGSAEGGDCVNLGDLMCPICRGILIEPVTLPCTHNLCLRCLKGTFEHNSLTCPLCRVRVGSWLRTATKSGTLVNSSLWQLIRTRFPKEVEGKDNGDERDAQQLHSGFASKKKIILNAAGEIRREYEARLQIAEEEMRRERESERLAGEEEEEEEEEREKLSRLASDGTSTKTLAKKQLREKNINTGKSDESRTEESERRNLGKNSSSERAAKHCRSFAGENRAPAECSDSSAEPGCSGTQIFGSRVREELRVPTDIFSSNKKVLDVEVCLNRNENDERIGSAESAGSHDSINQEIHHFKPIKPIPRTCLKMSADGRPIDPKLIRVVPLLRRVSNAVPKAPSPTRVKRIPGCSWSAFRGKARKSLEDRERGSLDENGSGPRIDRNEQRSSTSKASLKCSETSRSLETGGADFRSTSRHVGAFADANKNYAKSINRILNGTRVSKKLILEETTERTISLTNRAKKIRAIERTRKNGGTGGSGSGGENRSEENSSPEVDDSPRNAEALDDCSIMENIAERIKRRKFENSASLSNNSSLAPNRKDNTFKVSGKRRKMMEEPERAVVEAMNDSAERSHPARLRSDKSRDNKKSKGLANGRMVVPPLLVPDNANDTSKEENERDLERKIIEQQTRAEMIICQEKKDFELAMRLQAQFDDMARIAGRTRGSKRAMALNHDNSNHFIDLEINRSSRNTAKRPDATRTREQRRKPQKQSVK